MLRRPEALAVEENRIWWVRMCRMMFGPIGFAAGSLL